MISDAESIWNCSFLKRYDYYFDEEDKEAEKGEAEKG
jgi:hypothetical protein